MVSPMGEPLARLPPRVAALRMGGEPKRSSMRANSGRAWAGGGFEVGQRAAGAGAERVAFAGDGAEFAEAGEAHHAFEFAFAFVELHADIGAAGEDEGVGTRGPEPGSALDGGGLVEDAAEGGDGDGVRLAVTELGGNGAVCRRGKRFGGSAAVSTSRPALRMGS